MCPVLFSGASGRADNHLPVIRLNELLMQLNLIFQKERKFSATTAC